MTVSIDTAAAAALARDLDAADYRTDAVRAAWGDLPDRAIGQGLRGPALAALEGRTDPLAVVCRLLGVGAAASVAEVEAAFPACGVAGLIALDLVQVAGEVVVATALVRPQAFADGRGEVEWWIASDLDEAALGGELAPDHVLGVGGASLTLASLQLPAAAASVLDIGTGCGIQALRARRYADRVVATDVSSRALRFAALNAALAGDAAVELREGSLFEPVAGEQFDRVVSNPPFVITPRVAGVPAYEYRDAGFAGDDLVTAVVRGVGEVLTPGGVAQLLGNWEYRDGEDGLERVQAWVAASPVPLDAWIVEREQLDPLAYAQLWVRDGGSAPGGDDYARLVGAWLDDFADRGVTAVGFGYLLLRRATGVPSLARFERMPQPIDHALGPHLAASLAAHDRLAALTDAQLAASVLHVAPDVTEARHHRPGEEAPTVIELRQGAGFQRALVVDPGLAALVGACDGDLAVGVLVAAIADLLEVDADALAADLMPRVRELVVTGFLGFDGPEPTDAAG